MSERPDTGKTIAMGAEARLVAVEWNGVSPFCNALSKIRDIKSYRHPKLDRNLRVSRTRAEARLLHRARCAGVRTPVILELDLPGGIITMERLSGRPLMELLEGIEDKGDGGERREILSEVGKSIGRLHGGGMVHGDLTLMNILVERNDDDGVEGSGQGEGGAQGGCGDGGCGDGGCGDGGCGDGGCGDGGCGDGGCGDGGCGDGGCGDGGCGDGGCGDGGCGDGGCGDGGCGDGGCGDGGCGDGGCGWEVALIDFGLGSVGDGPEEQAVDLHVLMESLESTGDRAGDDFEMVWSGYADAFNRSDEVRDRLESLLKRGRYT